MIKLFAKKIVTVGLTSGGDATFIQNDPIDTGYIWNGSEYVYDIPIVSFGMNDLGFDSIMFNYNGTIGSGSALNNTLIELGGNYTITYKVHYRVDNPPYNYCKIALYTSDGTHIESSDWADNQTDGEYTYTINNAQGTQLRFSSLISQASVYDIRISGGVAGTNTGEPFTELDVETKESIVFNKALKDVRDPSKITGEFTKPFMLPVTEANAKFFGYLNDNDSISSFDIKNKIQSFITVDGINLLDGYIQLLKIVTTPTGAKYFNVIFYGSDISVFKDLTEVKLNDLDMTDTPIEYTASNIKSVIEAYQTGIEAKTGDTGYCFGLLERGENHGYQNGVYALNQWKNIPSDQLHLGALADRFTPGLYVWNLFEKIHEEQGFTIEGDIFEDDVYNQMVVPLTRKFKHDSGLGKASTIYNFEAVQTDSRTIQYGQYVTEDLFDISSQDGVTYPNCYGGGNYPTRFIPPTNCPVRATSNFEINVASNVTPNSSTPDANMSIKINFIFYASQTYGVGGNSSEDIYLFHTEYSGEDNWHNPGENDKNYTFNTGKLMFYAKNALGSDLSKYPHFKVKITYSHFHDDGGAPTNGDKMDVDLTITSTVSSTETGTYNLLPFGTTITNPSTYIGGDITQMDFVKSIVDMFNLYVTVDRVNSVISYNKWRDFYSSEIDDYTDKIILDKKIEKKFINDLIPRETKFEFDLLEGDYDTNDYIGNYNVNPTLKTFDSGNEFEQNIKTIDNKSKFFFNVNQNFGSQAFNIARFRNTDDVSTTNDSGFAFLFYSSEDSTSTFNLTSWDLTYESDMNKLATYKNSTELGSITPFLMSYGVPEDFYTNLLPSEPFKTFYDYYWGDYLVGAASVNSYLLTAEFYLTAEDYYNLKMNNKIKVGNELYFINKIKDWNPDKPTKVELIKFIYNDTYDFNNNDGTVSKYNGNNKLEEIGEISSLNSSNSSSTNTLLESNESLISNSEYVELIHSDNVNIGDSDNSIVKNSINVDVLGSPNASVTDSDNIRIENASNVTVVNSSGLVITEDNVTYINGVKYDDSGSATKDNVINSGGEDSVQDDFTDAGLIDAGENNIYGIDWKESYKVEDGGIDEKPFETI